MYVLIMVFCNLTKPASPGQVPPLAPLLFCGGALTEEPSPDGGARLSLDGWLRVVRWRPVLKPLRIAPDQHRICCDVPRPDDHLLHCCSRSRAPRRDRT